MKFLLQTQIGVEKITKLELESKFRGKYSLDFVGFIPDKNGIVQIDWRSEECFEYLRLGTIEDAFFVVEYVKDVPVNATLPMIIRNIDVKMLKRNVDYFFDSLNNFDRGKKFRLVVRKKSRHNFRRIDLQKTLAEFFEKKVPRVEITTDEGVKEIWINLLKNRLIISIRLTDQNKRKGIYKKQGVEGSLRPSVAYAAAFISEIKPSDVVWDPFCGAGTIACEVLKNFKFKRFFCSDISQRAVSIARENLGSLPQYKRYKSKISLKIQDFFESGDYADIIITNLPFGIKYPIDADFDLLFEQKVNQIKRLRQITLIFPRIIKIYGWQLTRKFHLELLGRKCVLQVFRKLRKMVANEQAHGGMVGKGSTTPISI